MAARCSRLPVGLVRATPDAPRPTRNQFAFNFSRWRAALARLPQVDMSHQRRRPFFVLSKNTR
ncbi:MAG TPA: hypothetical protein VN651_05695, partial [Gemmatimonadaceae bacterium]|nr:hypothetical protein [Gemmatimonadaceae bacterium]